MIKKITSWALAIMLIAIPFAALAGSMKVVPIKVFFDGQTTTAVLTLTNDGQDKITVQLDAKSWDQDDQGADRYSETRDIVFFPRILDIEPTTKRIVRIGYQGVRTPAKEKTYRIFVQELPVTNPGEMTLKFAITLSIPIFIQPSTERSDVAIEEVTQERGQIRVKVRNDGNTHAVVKGIEIEGLDAAGQQVFSNEMRGWYLLSDRTTAYELLIPEDGCSRTTEIAVTMKTESNTVATRLDANAGLCRASDADKNQDMQ